MGIIIYILFSSFSKVEEDDTDKSGLGLGLSICKSLVDLMKGDIWVNAKDGKGSCFYFSVPLITPPEEVIDQSGEGSVKTKLKPVVRTRDSVAV